MKYPWLDLIGFEFEGGWYEDETPSSSFGEMNDDGSIEDNELYDLGSSFNGEFNTYPETYEQIDRMIDECTPPFVHESCGLHIHLSFKNPESVLRICNSDFVKLITSETYQWAKEEFGGGSRQAKRIREGNNYSKPIWNKSDLEALCFGRDCNRYKHVNFLSYHDNERQTVEFRLHSAYNDPRQVKKALDIILECVDVWLWSTVAKCNEKVKFDLISDFADQTCCKIEDSSESFDYADTSHVSECKENKEVLIQCVY